MNRASVIQYQDLSIETDGTRLRHGPATKAHLRLTRLGIGGEFVLKGNPVSFIIDAVRGCIPFLSLRGGQDERSNAVRQSLAGIGAADYGDSFASQPVTGPVPDTEGAVIGTPVSYTPDSSSTGPATAPATYSEPTGRAVNGRTEYVQRPVANPNAPDISRANTRRPSLGLYRVPPR